MGNIYFKTKNIVIYNDDLLSIDCMDEDSIDLIETSLPYNVDVRYSLYDYKVPYEVYLEFTEKWLSKA